VGADFGNGHSWNSGFTGMWVDVGDERADNYDEAKRTVQTTENMV
jgi:hypothetical protein